MGLLTNDSAPVKMNASYSNVPTARRTFVSAEAAGMERRRRTETTKDRCDDRAPEPVLAAEVEDLSAVAGHRREQPRTKVARRVHGITGLHTEGCSDTENGDEQSERDKAGRRGAIAAVGERAYDHEEDGRAEKLIEEA